MTIHGWMTTFALANSLILQTSCSSDGGGEDGLADGGLDAAIVEYNAGRYDGAHAKSLAVMRSASEEGNPTTRDRAAYVAGLSAYRMRQYDEAEMRLLTSAQSTDHEVQGRSKALLGFIRLEQSRPASAAEYFRDAAPMLEGDEANEARYHASAAYEAAGNPTAARSLPSSPSSTSSGSMAAGGAGSGPGVFAIQVGAFENLANAQTAANEARTLASQHQLGDVRIIPRRDSRSRTLYVVQIGTFSSRTDAESARRRLGRMSYIVAPMSRG